MSYLIAVQYHIEIMLASVDLPTHDYMDLCERGFYHKVYVPIKYIKKRSNKLQSQLSWVI
jgi:hypothetical protein